MPRVREGEELAPDCGPVPSPESGVIPVSADDGSPCGFPGSEVHVGTFDAICSATVGTSDRDPITRLD